jgi:hypothetical protein
MAGYESYRRDSPNQAKSLYEPSLRAASKPPASTTAAVASNACLWHLADMETVLENVRFRGQSSHGLVLLKQSAKRFRPEAALLIERDEQRGF